MSASRAAWSSEWPLNSSDCTHRYTKCQHARRKPRFQFDHSKIVWSLSWQVSYKPTNHLKPTGASGPTEWKTWTKLELQGSHPTITLYSFIWNEGADNLWCNSLRARVGDRTSDYPPEDWKLPTTNYLASEAFQAAHKKECLFKSIDGLGGGIHAFIIRHLDKWYERHT